MAADLAELLVAALAEHGVEPADLGERLWRAAQGLMVLSVWDGFAPELAAAVTATTYAPVADTR